MNSISYAASDPYPTVKVRKKDMASACLLSQDFAGVMSEMTAINTYFYQSLVVRQCDPELSEVFAGIAKVEMRHLELLGQLIIEFGGDPQLKEVTCRSSFYWSARYVSCCKSIRQLLHMDIESEHKAIAGYEARLSQLCDENAKKVIDRILQDERLHLKILERFLHRTD